MGTSIDPFVSWMSGLPTETEQDLKQTSDLMDRMSETNDKTQHFGIFIYTPFPSPTVELLGSEFKPPRSLAEWGEIDVFHFSPPWHPKRYVKRLHAISAVTRYAFYPEVRMKESTTFYRLLSGIFHRIEKFRWIHRYFGVPVELRIVDAVARKLRGYT